MSEDRIEGTVKQGVGHVQDAVGGLTGDGRTQVKGKANEAAGSVQDTVGKVKGQAQEALGQAQEAYGQVRGQAKEAYGQVRAQAEDGFEDFESFLKERPLAGLGIGVGVGFVLGLLLTGGKKTVYVAGR